MNIAYLVHYKQYSYGCSDRAISTESFERIEKRLEHVNIEHKDFEPLIKQYDRPDTLFTTIRRITARKDIIPNVFPKPIITV